MNQERLLCAALKILKIKNCNATINSNSELNLRTQDGQVLKCFIPAATYIGKLSTKDRFIGETKEEEASLYQWLEYCSLHSSHQDKEMLLELNSYLKDKVYFVGNRFTIVDLLLYLSLYEIYSKMSFQEKESYCNLSRWFRLVQHESNACDFYPKIYFSKTRLYT